MHIPPLSADLRFRLLTNLAQDISFSFDVKKAAMGPHIAHKWGWDEEYQFKVHLDHFREKPFFAIERSEEKIGTLSLLQQDGFARFGEFYILPEGQRRGLGTRILRHILQVCDDSSLPVRLEYLKWNPVGSLYERHGFAIIGETDIHWLMERPSVASAAQQSEPVER
jgi:GNAT superfamily N-acetyltransferase